MLAGISPAPCLPQRRVLWQSELVGVVYVSELFSLPPSRLPWGWPDLSVPGESVVEGLTGIGPKALHLASCFQIGSRLQWWAGVSVVPRLFLRPASSAAEACGRSWGRELWLGAWESPEWELGLSRALRACWLTTSSPEGMGRSWGIRTDTPPPAPRCHVALAGHSPWAGPGLSDGSWSAQGLMGVGLGEGPLFPPPPSSPSCLRVHATGQSPGS